MNEYMKDHDFGKSPTIAFSLLGSSPFGSDPTFMSRTVQLLPIDVESKTVKFSSLELLNELGDGFRNDEYYDTVHIQAQANVKAAWQNLAVPESIPQCSQVKFLVRRGIPDDLRQMVWKALSGWTVASKEYPTLYADALTRAFGAKPPLFFRNYPMFGGLISPSDHFLIGEAGELVKRLLVVIGLNFPLIDYCPCLPDFIQILLTFLSESDTFGVLWCMLKRSGDTRKYLLISRRQTDQFNAAFVKVVARQIPKLHKHMVALKIPSKESCPTDSWFSRLFVAEFPYQVVLRIFDTYMSEGVKVLYRFALAVLDHNKDALLRTTTAEQFRLVLSTHNVACDADQLIKSAFAYRLRRKDMEMDLILPPAPMDEEEQLPVFYRPKIAQPSSIIEDDKFEILWAWIPHRICIQDPYLLYSAEKHGWSLATITYRCRNESPILLMIKSDSGAVFGAFLTSSLSTTRTEYYGDRGCFLWTLQPATSCYRWSAKNDLFIKGHADYFCIGSGGSGYGLYIHKDMWGRTDPCDTFDNPPLDPVKPEHFQIVALEVYAFR